MVKVNLRILICVLFGVLRLHSYIYIYYYYYYLPIVNSKNRSAHERYLKNPQKHTFYFSPISTNDILIAIGDYKSKYLIDFSNIDMNIIKIVFNFILDPLTFLT